MNQKNQSASALFVKLPTTLYNTRADRPKLNSLERDLYAYISSWTNGGRGKYNHEGTKEISRRLGSSNKSVIKALHRLKALGLLNWYAFPHGVGVKHLRFVSAAGLEKWHSKAAINEPTAAELEAAAELTSVESLKRNVCAKPNAMGAKIWRACCEYCGVNTDEIKRTEPTPAVEAAPATEARTEQPTPAVTMQSEASASGWDSVEFQNAWQEWKRHRKSSGRPLRAEAERIALAQLEKEAQNEADAINAIYSAISGGFISIKPDIARLKAANNSNAPRPVNAWDWLQNKFTELKRQPSDDEEVKQWLTEFRERHGDAPAFVVWDKKRRIWSRPEDPMREAANAGINGRYARILAGFETLRQHIDGDLDVVNEALRNMNAKSEAEKAVEEARKKHAQEIENAFREEVQKRGGKTYWLPSEWSAANEAIIEAVREILPESLYDCELRFPEKYQAIARELEDVKSSELNRLNWRNPAACF